MWYILTNNEFTNDGFIDAIVGGGGLITLPAILGLGVPLHLAVATGK